MWHRLLCIQKHQNGILCMFIASHRNIIAAIVLFDIYIFFFPILLCLFECQKAILYFSTILQLLRTKCRPLGFSTYFGRCTNSWMVFCWPFENAILACIFGTQIRICICRPFRFLLVANLWSPLRVCCSMFMWMRFSCVWRWAPFCIGYSVVYSGYSESVSHCVVEPRRMPLPVFTLSSFEQMEMHQMAQMYLHAFWRCPNRIWGLVIALITGEKDVLGRTLLEIGERWSGRFAGFPILSEIHVSTQ